MWPIQEPTCATFRSTSLPFRSTRLCDGEESLADTLTRIGHVAATDLGADMAGITMLNRSGRGMTFAYTDETAPELDQRQYDADRGPCLDAARTARLLRMHDARNEDRWPKFAAAATAHGIRSSVSFPLIVDGRSIGALNLYARPTQQFDPISEDFGLAFARQAAAAVAFGVAYWEKVSLAEQLQAAMASRAVIEQAKGILMGTTGCSPEEAFNLLRQQSQTQNIKLRDVAADLVALQQRR